MPEVDDDHVETEKAPTEKEEEVLPEPEPVKPPTPKPVVVAPPSLIRADEISTKLRMGLMG